MIATTLAEGLTTPGSSTVAPQQVSAICFPAEQRREERNWCPEEGFSHSVSLGRSSLAELPAPVPSFLHCKICLASSVWCFALSACWTLMPPLVHRKDWTSCVVFPSCTGPVKYSLLLFTKKNIFLFPKIMLRFREENTDATFYLSSIQNSKASYILFRNVSE